MPLSGVCDIAYSYKRQVLTSLDKALFKRISVYGYVSCALHIDESMDLISLMTELAISALAECAYQKPPSLYRACAWNNTCLSSTGPVLCSSQLYSSLITELFQTSWPFVWSCFGKS